MQRRKHEAAEKAKAYSKNLSNYKAALEEYNSYRTSWSDRTYKCSSLDMIYHLGRSANNLSIMKEKLQQSKNVLEDLKYKPSSDHAKQTLKADHPLHESKKDESSREAAAMFHSQKDIPPGGPRLI